MNNERQKLCIDFKLSKSKSEEKRFSQNYYLKEGKYYQIPRRDSVEYLEYQSFLKSQLKEQVLVKREGPTQCNNDNILKLLSKREYLNSRPQYAEYVDRHISYVNLLY
jgi:hypothetical protein